MNPVSSIEEIRIRYSQKLTRHKNIEEYIEKRITQREQQTERLKAKLKNHNKSYPYWTEDLLRPVIDKIKQHLPEWVCEDDRLTPMGLGARVSVFFTRKATDTTGKSNSPKYLYVTFLPGDLTNAQLLYETGKKKNRFASGTIGEINGFNNAIKEVKSIDEIVQFLRTQIK